MVGHERYLQGGCVCLFCLSTIVCPMVTTMAWQPMPRLSAHSHLTFDEQTEWRVYQYPRSFMIFPPIFDVQKTGRSVKETVESRAPNMELGGELMEIKIEYDDTVGGEKGLREKRLQSKSKRCLRKGDKVEPNPCAGKRCGNNCEINFTNEDRIHINELYWGLRSTAKQNNWLLTCVEQTDVRRRRSGGGLRITTMNVGEGSERIKVKTGLMATHGASNSETKTGQLSTLHKSFEAFTSETENELSDVSVCDDNEVPHLKPLQQKLEKRVGKSESVGPNPCAGKTCINNCAMNFTEEDRSNLHALYWGLGSKAKQQYWLLTCVTQNNVSRRNTEGLKVTTMDDGKGGKIMEIETGLVAYGASSSKKKSGQFSSLYKSYGGNDNSSESDNALSDVPVSVVKMVGMKTYRKKPSLSKPMQAKLKKRVSKGETAGPNPCAGQRCRNKCALNFSEEDISYIHTLYWGLGSIAQQKDWLLTYVAQKNVRRRKIEGSDKHSVTYDYYLPCGDGRKKVCQQFLLKTLNISQSTLQYIFETKTAIVPDEQIDTI